MNDGKIIIDKILAEAQAEANVIVENGRVAADKILRVAEDRAEREALALAEIARTEAERAKQKEISAAQMQGKKAVLEQKQQILADVLKEAEHVLNTLPDAEYAQIVGLMLEKIGKEPGMEIIVSSRDRDRLAEMIARKGFTLSDTTRPIEGGFVAKSGDIEYNYSFESIITVEKEALQKVAVDILF